MSKNNNVGGYATLTRKSMPWITQGKKNTKSKNKKRIVNPIFEQCAQLAEDEEWKSRLEDAAKGKFPKGFLYQDGFLSYKKGNKIEREEIPSEPVDALEATIKFFQEKGNIRSSRDKEEENRKKLEADRRSMCNNNIEWKNVNRDKIKDALINEYVDRLAREYSLDSESRSKLISLIYLGLNLGYLDSSNIQMSSGKISSISILRFVSDEEGFILDTNKSAKKLKLPSNTINEVTDPTFSFNDRPVASFKDLWDKYRKSVNRKSQKSNVKRVQDSASTTKTTPATTPASSETTGE